MPKWKLNSYIRIVDSFRNKNNDHVCSETKNSNSKEDLHHLARNEKVKIAKFLKFLLNPIMKTRTKTHIPVMLET